MFSALASAAASFVLLPHAYETSAPWITQHVLSGYGAAHADDFLLAWKVLLALLIFASVRVLLKLAFSAASLALAMRVVSSLRDR